MELLDYEKRHIDYFEKNAHESVLFLKRNDAFPISNPCKVALFGCGARHTVKGGTGSGDVASRFFVNFEDGFKNAGFEITSTKWLDEYDSIRNIHHKEFRKDVIKRARKDKTLACVYQMGCFEEEHNYDLSIDYEGDIAVYVISRNSGEGNDRRNIKGDVKLSDTEVKDILDLNNRFSKFVLVLNVGGVIDLTPVLEVSNILYLSQLGVVTGSILPKILLGEVNPSGKLATTWTKPEDYPFFEEFGNLHDTYYKEGIYVGYRYFDSINKEVYFPFGYGLSYSTFNLSLNKTNVEGTKVIVDINVLNTSEVKGKEVVQIYLSSPKGKLPKVRKELVGFNKTNELEPHKEECVSTTFDLLDFANYDEETASYLLEKGEYIVYAGNSSKDVFPVCKLVLKETVITRKLQNKLGKTDFEEYVLENDVDSLEGLNSYEIDTSSIVIEEPKYEKNIYIDESLKDCSNEDLARICVGQFGKGVAAIVGESSVHVIGAAGETTNNVPAVKDFLSMADGPAGIRVIQEYGIDKKGVYTVKADPIMLSLSEYLPLRFISKRFVVQNNSKRGGERHYQYSTAIPIGTALAQSFNKDYLFKVGKIVSEEMEYFGVDLWLAPALNIHRNILCGRNFEYFSEDPYVSGIVAAYITNGVQTNPRKGTTIKHFFGNNQELNRNNNNDHMSERVAREIYLRGFEICIKESNPKAVMTSYNLINGVHTSESYELINDILRCEWGYEGLVMTDWIASGRSFCYGHKYPAPYAGNNVHAGNDLTMPGSNGDIRNILKYIKDGKISREDLLISASRIVRSIKKQKQ